MNIDSNKIIELIKVSAREELLTRFTSVSAEKKADGSIVTEADLAMQNRLEKELSSSYPDTILLSEEMMESEQQVALKSDTPIWCLDPLDGTSNFASGIPYFAVSLSLIENNEVVMGLVYDPIRDECFYADTHSAASLNNEDIKIDYLNDNINDAIAIIDLKRLDGELSTRLVQEQPFASQRNFGASALDWCWLSVSRGHLYIHGKQNVWDYSAGQFIFSKAGGVSTTLNGEPVFNCQLEGRSVIAAVNESLFNNWASWVNK